MPEQKESGSRNPDAPRRRKSRRKIIRRLVEEEIEDRGNVFFKRNPILWAGVVIALLFFVLVGYELTAGNDGSLLKNFTSTYRQQYHQLVHGDPNYCDAQLDTASLFARIREQQILHQDEALQKLESALHNDSNFNAIAVVGPSGVGKSLWASLLEQYFPWPDNVHWYDWNTFVEDEAEKFHIVRLYLENLSDCGGNLLIFDSLVPCDRELVAIVNKIMTHGEDGRLFSNKRVIIIYIFRLSNMNDDETLYKYHFDLLQDLPDTTTINFKQFGAEELKDCIRREMASANLTLSLDDFDEIMATIDVKHSGCKNVRAKVLTFGKPRG